VVFRRERSAAGVKKRRETTVVRGDEIIFGQISRKKSCCDPSILDYVRASRKHDGIRAHQLPFKTQHMFQPFPVYTAKSYILKENFQCETHPYGSHGDQQHLPLGIKPCRQIVVNFEGLAAAYKRRFGNDPFP
jgi:hypothetical protein